MIGGLRHAPADLRVASGVERRARDDFLKQVGRDQSGAREGEEHAAWPEQFEREQVDVFVAPARLLDLRARFGKFGRVEDDQVELAARVPMLPQDVENVAGHVFNLG